MLSTFWCFIVPEFSPLVSFHLGEALLLTLNPPRQPKGLQLWPDQCCQAEGLQVQINDFERTIHLQVVEASCSFDGNSFMTTLVERDVVAPAFNVLEERHIQRPIGHVTRKRAIGGVLHAVSQQANQIDIVNLAKVSTSAMIPSTSSSFSSSSTIFLGFNQFTATRT